MQFEHALEGYWLEKGRNFSQATIDNYQYAFNYFIAFVDARTHIEEITSDHVRQFLNHLKEEKGLGPKTCKNIWIALSGLWSWAAGEFEIEHIIRGKVQCPKVPKRQIVPYTQDEVKAMLYACETTGGKLQMMRPHLLRNRAIIVIMADTGVRVSELCALKIENYSRKRGQLMVLKGKGDKDRTVFLGQSGRRALWRYLGNRPDAKDSDPLIATKNNTHLSRTNLLKMLKSVARHADVTGANCHRFRHTFAINFLRNGGNPLELQQLLGHENLETVNIYVNLASVDLENAQRVASPADNWKL